MGDYWLSHAHAVHYAMHQSCEGHQCCKVVRDCVNEIDQQEVGFIFDSTQ